MTRNLFLFLLMCSFASPSLWAKSQESFPAKEHQGRHFNSFTGKIVGNKVRMRLHPNLDGHIVRELPKGEIYAVVAESDDYYGVVPSSTMKAYIYKTFVLDNKVEAEHVNIRLNPSLDAPIVAQLNSGDHVDVQLAPDNSKWYEISFPPGVTFWVAKEYLENIGPVEYAHKYTERISEANQLLATAELITQSEFRKEFPEIDLRRLVQNFQKISRDYKDLEQIRESALQSITNLEKEYCSMKIAFLEGKAGKAALEVENLNAKLSNFDQNEPLDALSLMEEIQATQLVLDFPEMITDKMKVWQPIEFALFQAWATNNEDATQENYYGEEALNAESLVGIIEPFNTLIKHKPGDFVLTLNGQTIAYLYSTHINLQDVVGKKLSLKVSPRDNHNFAFPAYYVLEIQE